MTAPNIDGPRDPMEQSWVPLKDVAHLFGMTFDSVKNLVAKDKFPVPTYRLGRMRVVDKDVLAAFWDQQRREGIRRLRDKPPDTKAR